jgi:2',3'-cyclic-nucleotide 2'-phosphodiesterase (5'-nucleotidase family)
MTLSRHYRRAFGAALAVLLLPAVLAVAAPGDVADAASLEDIRSLLILHTNDMHDHVRADYDGRGGLPYVAGFIRSVRAARDDVLVMDAGDVAEKGDLVARRTDSDMTFMAMRRAGYDVWVPGNHDHDFGIDALHRFTRLAEMDIVCINLLKEDGAHEFPPSAVYEVNGMRVGVIGAITPRSERSLDLVGTARAMSEEARRLKPDTDIIVGLVHLSVRDSEIIARTAGDIDVIVSGHSHERTELPVVVPETGALIVQAGYYARYVGRLELRVDVRNRVVSSWDYQLVAMDHASIHPDLEMLEWVRQQELVLAPEASRIISWSPRDVSRIEVGILAAEALRRATGADVAFHKSAHILRAAVPAGIHDLNAIYRSGGERGEHLVKVDLTGAEIHEYMRRLPLRGWLPTQWSGFRGGLDGPSFSSDLSPSRTYTVVMPEREWQQRFLRAMDGAAHHEARPVAMKWIEALAYLLSEYEKEGTTLLDAIQAIAEETGQMPLLAQFLGS